jgi:hypothetical protein
VLGSGAIQVETSSGFGQFAAIEDDAQADWRMLAEISAKISPARSGPYPAVAQVVNDG